MWVKGLPKGQAAPHWVRGSLVGMGKTSIMCTVIHRCLFCGKDLQLLQEV